MWENTQGIGIALSVDHTTADLFHRVWEACQDLAEALVLGLACPKSLLK